MTKPKQDPYELPFSLEPLEPDKWPISVFSPTVKGSINGRQIVVMPATIRSYGLVLPDLAGLTPLPEVIDD